MHSGFIFATGPGNSPLTFGNVHIARLSADEGLVYFHFARKFHERTRLNGLANTVHHVPRRLLSDVQMARDLITANAVFAGDDEPHGKHPFVHTQR
jgi:hypothetical protein